MILKSISSLFLLGLALKGNAQDPSFTQFNSVPLFYNPAYTGSSGSPRLATAYRYEGNGGRQLGYLSYDQPVRKLHGAIGLMVSDNSNKLTPGWQGLAGTYHTNTLSYALTYAAKFKLSDKWSLSPAIKVGYRRLDIESFNENNYKNLYLNDLSHDLKTKEDFDLGFGVLLNTQKLHFGLAVDHINRPYKNADPLYNFSRKYSLQFGYTFQRSNGLLFTPSLLCAVQGDFVTLKVNLSAKYKWLAFGASLDSDLSPMVGYAGKKLNIGCSYGINKKAYEVSLRYNFMPKTDAAPDGKPVKKHRVFRNRKRILQN